MANEENRLKGYFDIGKLLSSQNDIEKIFELFIDSCMDITSCDAGTIYAIEDESKKQWSFYEENVPSKKLKFAIARNKSIDIKISSTLTPILKNSIFGYSVIYGDPIRIDDAYKIPTDANYKFNSSFDKMTGYRTKTMLTIPMKDHHDRVIGVVQLINKKHDCDIVPFTEEDEVIISSLAGQASVNLENTILYSDLDYLIDQYKMINCNTYVKHSQNGREVTSLLEDVKIEIENIKNKIDMLCCLEKVKDPGLMIGSMFELSSDVDNSLHGIDKAIGMLKE